ncbi:helix-turn-helix domain-containing protein [Bifidobacterium callitrichos]|uniref:Helix-turn-helix domain-containing protein n=1 Tax=Bifidobacterium callitrichos TaxID=762209 RepID=A0A5M9ZCN5_9BIFI|nr:nucleotidyltransferase domain-containing protein [Bifidobacterium callitrichos]KAA8816532.1 helix-turn-helix domain-containing protein [Bifidobacterium callitrichos]
MKSITELRTERVLAHISQSDVAASMGTTQSAVSRTEREGNPTQDFLQRYEIALRNLTAADTGISESPASASPTPEPTPESSSSPIEIALIRAIVAGIAKRYGIADMYVFGSTARGDARADSDVDLLYRLESGASHSMMTMQRLTAELESAIGRTVSLTSYDSLLRSAQRSQASRRFLEHISRDMIKVA